MYCMCEQSIYSEASSVTETRPELYSDLPEANSDPTSRESSYIRSRSRDPVPLR